MAVLANTRRKLAAEEATSVPQQGSWASWVVVVQEAGP